MASLHGWCYKNMTPACKSTAEMTLPLRDSEMFMTVTFPLWPVLKCVRSTNDPVSGRLAESINFA